MFSLPARAVIPSRTAFKHSSLIASIPIRRFRSLSTPVCASHSSTSSPTPPNFSGLDQLSPSSRGLESSPGAPEPILSDAQERHAWKNRNRNLLYGDPMKQAGQASRSVGEAPLKRRFWKKVQVVEKGKSLQVHLDSRPLRTSTKEIIRLPKSKRHLALALALEWDHLPTAQHALKQHYIPLTTLISRAEDIANDPSIRTEIVKMCMRYLRTDTLLCWAPPEVEEQDRSFEETPSLSSHGTVIEPAKLTNAARGGRSLRAVQQGIADDVIGWLTSNLWPGIKFFPALDGVSILPRSQDEQTVAVVRGWLDRLPAYELAGLERAMLASKSLLLAVRVVAEWSPAVAGPVSDTRVDTSNTASSSSAVTGPAADDDITSNSSSSSSLSSSTPFGIEEAYAAATAEVRWQTDMWGEVEDTHDVDREDLRRQLGSVILLVS